MAETADLELLRELAWGFFKSRDGGKAKLTIRILEAADQALQAKQCLFIEETQVFQYGMRKKREAPLPGWIQDHVSSHLKAQLRKLDIAPLEVSFQESRNLDDQIVKSMILLPVVSIYAKVLGVLCFLSPDESAFDETQKKSISLVGLMAGLALDQCTNENTGVTVEENSPLQTLNPGLMAQFARLIHYAQSDSSVLIEGESGTGKEVIARQLHEKSKRKDAPFVAINCAAIPESLFEAELFGVQKGAATGTSARKGKIESADGGTLFLDEIGELPLSVQAKLLRVIQEKSVTKVGSDEAPKRVDFRIVSATNRNLALEVSQGRFREDLFYRLNVLSFRLPSLRDRMEDLPSLCARLLANISATKNLSIKTLSSDALLKIQAYHWPGNIRELQNCLEAACIAANVKPTIEAGDLSFLGVAEKVVHIPSISIQSQTTVIEDYDLKNARSATEAKMISAALLKTGGNKSKAANLLGLSREGLRKLMTKSGPRKDYLKKVS